MNVSRIALVAGSVAAMALTLHPAAVLAAKGGKNSAQAVTLAVAPNPASPHSYVQVGGCGYVPNQGVVLGVQSPTAIASAGGPADAAGCISMSWYVYDAGAYLFSTYQESNNGKLTPLASVSVAVQ